LRHNNKDRRIGKDVHEKKAIPIYTFTETFKHYLNIEIEILNTMFNVDLAVTFIVLLLQPVSR